MYLLDLRCLYVLHRLQKEFLQHNNAIYLYISNNDLLDLRCLYVLHRLQKEFLQHDNAIYLYIYLTMTYLTWDACTYSTGYRKSSYNTGICTAYVWSCVVCSRGGWATFVTWTDDKKYQFRHNNKTYQFRRNNSRVKEA
jgi:hypothetical protein